MKIFNVWNVIFNYLFKHITNLVLMKVYVISILLVLLVGRPVFCQVETIRKLQLNLPLIKDSIHYVDAINRISLLYYEQNIDSTLYYSIQARGISNRLKYAQGLADATNNLGIVYDIKGNIQLALRYYNDAYNQYKSIGDSSNVIQTLMNIAMVYNLSGKDQKSVSNFKQALFLGNKIAKDSINALVIFNYIILYPKTFPDKIKKGYIEKAGKIALKCQDVRLQLALEQLIADDYIANNKHDKGIALLKQTLSKTLDMKLFYLSIDLLLDLGDTYMLTDEKMAISYYDQAMAITEQKGYRLYSRDISKKLYEHYSAKNDIATAYIYSQKLIKLYEEQTEIDKGSGIDYIEYAIKDQQLESAEVKSAYGYRLLWLAVAVCILTFLSLLFLWSNWRLTRRTHEVLKLQFRQLESTTEALETSNKNYAGVIKMVAHDLRNPIGAINTMSSIVLDKDTTYEDAMEFTQLIHDSSNSCIKLIGDLMEADFNLKESELNKEEIDLPSFLRQAVKLLAFRAKEKNQQLVLNDEVGAVIRGDRDKLLRVVNNLVVNAIKFSPSGSAISIYTKRLPEGILITVKDNGLGIPKEISEKLFDPFTPSKRRGTAGEQPFGLGLYISKQIVEAHHGRIWFESEPEKGTSFFVLLTDEVVMNRSSREVVYS